MMDIKAISSSEISKPSATENKSFDPDKRIDVNQKQDTKGSSGYDVDKRVESQENKLEEALNDYIDDLKSKSECPETISTVETNLSKMEKQPSERVAELREEFDDNKSKLRKEWEIQNGREWPKYTEDVYNENGQIIRRKGDNYDAHHIQPLCLGGKNIASNITPLDIYSHRDIHSSNGSCKNLVNVLGGNN